jgi:superfamily II DNA or RNA helicase
MDGSGTPRKVRYDSITRHEDVRIMRGAPDLNDMAPITLATYQTLWAGEKGRGLLHRMANSFGFIIADECQAVPADTFQYVFASFNARFKLGMTGTLSRSDKKHVYLSDVIGPVTAQGRTAELKCHVVVHTLSDPQQIFAEDRQPPEHMYWTRLWTSAAQLPRPPPPPLF